MRMAGRVAAAIEVLNEVFTQHRPASEALKDWGKAHRFAGSTDRHAIGTLVHLRMDPGLRRGDIVVVDSPLPEASRRHPEDIGCRRVGRCLVYS